MVEDVEDHESVVGAQRRMTEVHVRLNVFPLIVQSGAVAEQVVEKDEVINAKEADQKALLFVSGFFGRRHSAAFQQHESHHRQQTQTRDREQQRVR